MTTGNRVMEYVAGKKSENWQQFQKEESAMRMITGSREKKKKKKRQKKEAFRNMNDQWQVPAPAIDLGDQTKAGCLPALWTAIKNAFKRSASGGCLLQLSILLLPLVAVGAILFIAL